jgi:hypothetical protein
MTRPGEAGCEPQVAKQVSLLFPAVLLTPHAPLS